MNLNNKTLCRSILFGALILLNACATSDESLNLSQDMVFNTKGSSYKVGKPYKVMGQWYTPKEDFDYNEVGIASWYGKDFHAKYTANGEVYDMNSLTAAHKTLPLPSIVRVTNLENGRSLVLRINDRGPFVNGRIIDVSKRGAQLLGFQNQGTAKVRVEVLKEESMRLKQALLNKEDTQIAVRNTPSPAPTAYTSAGDKIQAVGAEAKYAQVVASEKKKYFVQAGAFSNQEIAGKLSRRLNSIGNTFMSPTTVDGWRFYRVRLGPYNTENDAKLALAKVQDYGVAEATIVKD